MSTSTSTLPSPRGYNKNLQVAILQIHALIDKYNLKGSHSASFISAF